VEDAEGISGNGLRDVVANCDRLMSGYIFHGIQWFPCDYRALTVHNFSHAKMTGEAGVHARPRSAVLTP
jgi:hypothetical protein